MRLSLAEAQTKLGELVERAAAGEEVIVTREGRPAAKIVPVNATIERESRRRLLEAARASAATKLLGGPSAARSQDFLYGDSGLPE